MKKNTIMIAHKGYSGKYPENTLLAFKMAGKNGFGGAETDVRITKDGVFVTHHDNEVHFSDGSSLLISESTFEELTEKPLRNRTTDDEVYICSFKSYLETMKQYSMICFIELKGEFTPEQVKGVFDLAKEIYDLKKCILQSFEFDNLISARELFSDLPLMLTYGKDQSNYERCFDYGFSIDVEQYAVTQEMIDEFHKKGLEVGVWTVNEQENIKMFKEMQVDYIESDFFC